MIAGIMAAGNHPLLERCVRSVMEICDSMVIRIDKNVASEDTIAIIRRCVRPGDIVFGSDKKWNTTIWRRELLGALIQSGMNPDIVVALDHDEEFDDGAIEEIAAFKASDRRAMMFSYVSPMPTDDGRIVIGGRAYPDRPHMKVFKYQRNLTYNPYHGYAIINPYADKKLHWMALTKIRHFSLWNKDLESEKKSWIRKIYGKKLVRRVYGK